MGDVAHISNNQAGFSLTPQSLDEAMKYADIIARSDIVPKDYKGNSSNILVAVQMGAELGLPPLQALQNIAVINGRPSVWGDSLIAIARAHPACEYITETFDENSMTATCKIKRRGEPEQTRTFSQNDASTAGLWGKQGPWKTNPKRMLQMRARGFAIRDVFPDALRGIALAEEAQDLPPRDMGPVDRVDERQPDAGSLPVYPADNFEANFGKWLDGVKNGKVTVDGIIAKIGSAYKLTDDQLEQIEALRDVEPIDGGAE